MAHQKPREPTKYLNTQRESDPTEDPWDKVRFAFAYRVQRLMFDNGWTQSDLARRAQEHMPEGVRLGRDHISNYIRGRNLPEPMRLEALVKAFGLNDPTELLPAVAIPKAGATAPLDARDIGNGNVWLKINQAVSWDKALKIMAILNEGE